jgi:uncharacterized membrane protein YtjA (UPF0391 family)
MPVKLARVVDHASRNRSAPHAGCLRLGRTTHINHVAPDPADTLKTLCNRVSRRGPTRFPRPPTERPGAPSVCRRDASTGRSLRNTPQNWEDIVMLKWAFICAIIAIIAAALGFTGVAGAAAGIAKFLFFAFLVIFLVMLILGLAAGRKVSSTIRRKDTDYIP